MRTLSSLVAFLLTLGAPAHAASLCTGIAPVLDGLRASGDTALSDAALDLEGAAACGVAREAAGASHYCYWEHPFRSDEAKAQVDDLERELHKCLSLTGEGTQDQSVNHPDSYDLRTYDIVGASISLSLKDKGALNRSLVFLRISALATE